MAHRDSLRLELPEPDAESAFEALVAANQRWLGHYARLHPSFGVEASMLERNSLWMNAFFQKSRMVTPPASAGGKELSLARKVTQKVLTPSWWSYSYLDSRRARQEAPTGRSRAAAVRHAVALRVGVLHERRRPHGGAHVRGLGRSLSREPPSELHAY